MDQLVVGILLGGSIVGFIWLMVFAAQYNIDAKHEIWRAGRTYSTKRAHRVMGQTGERVASSGQWIVWTKSLWKTYPDFRDQCYFFTIELDELNPAKLVPLSPTEAANFIRKHADPDMAAKLVRDWVDHRNPEWAGTA